MSLHLYAITIAAAMAPVLQYCCCLCRGLLQLGPMLKAAWLNLLQLKVFAMDHPPKVLALSRTSPAYTFLTGALLAISTSTRRLPPSPTPLPPNCTQLYIQCLQKSRNNHIAIHISDNRCTGNRLLSKPINNTDNQPLPAIDCHYLLLRSSSRSRRILCAWRP